MKGFFSFYADFNYRNDVICPYLGRKLCKTDFTTLNSIPKEMGTYRDRLEANHELEYFRIDSPLCIQDPVDLSQNMTKAVKKHRLRAFKKYCSDCAAKL